MDKSIAFKKATKNDLPEIIRMIADDQLGRTRENYSEPLDDCYYEAFEKINNDPNQNLMVVLLDTEIVGVFQLTFIPYLTHKGSLRAQIEGVRIKSNKRGLGLGKKMMDWAIQKSKKEGAFMLQLTTNKKRKKAHEFYKKLGFEDSHEGMKYYL